MEPILSFRDLRVVLGTDRRRHEVVRGVSLDLLRGEILAVVGESGSGKSLTALSALGLLPKGIAAVSAGSIDFDGIDLASASERHLDDIRGSRIGMVFQEPLSSLNPVMRIGDQITEGLVQRGTVTRKVADKMALETLRSVRVSDPESRLRQYPHELSGGMRQRVMIALSLISNPEILIADEPTTALDVTVQAQILDVLKSQQRLRGLSMLIITHDLGVVAEVADRVAVMYAGEIIEIGDVETVLTNPRHPYTLGLLSCLPEYSAEGRRLAVIPGTVPGFSEELVGCAFKRRCPLYAMGPCDEAIPLIDGENGHAYRCVRPLESRAETPVHA
jgi:oligopeptide/dipeptide ABC transporter ATP-binding protein